MIEARRDEMTILYKHIDQHHEAHLGVMNPNQPRKIKGNSKVAKQTMI